MPLTDLERKVLEAIRDDEYQDGSTEICINNPVWVFSVSSTVGGTKIFSGVMSSLKKKGLAGMDGAKYGQDRCCWLTKEGFDAIIKNKEGQ